MLGFVKKKRKETVELVGYHFDTLSAEEAIDKPHLEVRGWLSFDLPFDLSQLAIELQIGSRYLTVPQQSRADVEIFFPDEFTTGFDRLLCFIEDDLVDALVSQTPMSLEVSWPTGSVSLPIKYSLSADCLEQSSYFRVTNKLNNEPYDIELKHWHENGFTLLERFFSEAEIDKINSCIEHAWSARASFSPQVTVDRYIGTPDEKRQSLAETDPAIRDKPYKLNDLYLESDTLCGFVLDQRLRTILTPLIGGTPMICNSLSFERGSQQEDHFDTFFMPPLIRNRMLATWIALEDVDLDAGPLHYYPGSHKIPPYRFNNGRFNMLLNEKPDCYAHINKHIQQYEIAPVTFAAKKGDVFVWHAHLFHGGLPINNPNLTRKSVVTHYFCCEDWRAEEIGKFGNGGHYLKRRF